MISEFDTRCFHFKLVKGCEILLFPDMSGLGQCEDILLFQRTLKKLRDIDDKIIYASNLSTPTKSFQVSTY